MEEACQCPECGKVAELTWDYPDYGDPVRMCCACADHAAMTRSYDRKMANWERECEDRAAFKRNGP